MGDPRNPGRSLGHRGTALSWTVGDRWRRRTSRFRAREAAYAVLNTAAWQGEALPPLDPPSLLAVGAVGRRVPHPEPGGRLDRQAGDRGASVVRATCGLGPRGRGARVRRCAPWWAAPLPGGQPLRHTDAGLQRFRRRRPRMSMATEKCTLLAIEKCTLSGSSREGSEATGPGLPFAHDRTWSERGHFYCAESGHFYCGTTRGAED